MSSCEGVAATLVKQLEAIDHTIVALLSRGAKLLAEDKTIDKQRVCALGALLAELYFLGDAWRRLRDEVVAQHDRPITQDAGLTSSAATKPAVLEECDNLLCALSVHLEHLSFSAALELQAAALDCREHILEIASTKDVDDIYQQLSTFRGGSCFGLSASLLFESTPWFMAPDQGFSTTHAEGTFQSNPTASSPRNSQKPTAADVVAWLDTILSRELSRDPDEYYQEQINLKTFRSRHPEFSTAAAKWPTYAEEFWPTLKPQLSFLFQPPGPYNMVQWALEYARVTFPETFGDTAPSQDALLDLTDALCDGSFTPLHLAATLGLPTLCRAVLSMNEEEEIGVRHDKYRRGGPFGTPIYCALVGPEVLKCGLKALSWASILHEHENPQTRAATVSVFLDANHPCGDGIVFGNGEQASFVGLAFWVALLSKDEAILDRVLDAGATVDESMQSFLQYEPLIDFLQSGSADLSFFVRLLVVIFDEVLVEVEGGIVSTTLSDVNVLGAIEDVMTDLKLDFSMIGEKKRVEWPDRDFHRLVYSYIRLEAFPQGLQRLVQDPRFNPSQRVLEDPDSTGTLLHMAVSNEMPDVVDILARAGADLTAVDEEGRTPLMCVESTPMLAKLINDHGDTTTATDYHGRNIWHYAAASNDVLLLKWLSEHDPWKEENLKATTTTGCTPAAEAFLYIDQVATMTKENDLSEPLTARIILKQCRDITYLESSRSLAHVAAAWGRQDLLEALAGRGVDFHEIDQNGRTAMHHLNAYASQEVVMRFQQLCRGLPIATDHGQTPAETMLKNTVLYMSDETDQFEASSHPSCYGTLGDGFKQLLTPEVLAYKDFRGRGLWARFCEVIRSFGTASQNLLFLRRSILSGICILAGKDMLGEYERMTGRCAVYALANPDSERAKWDRNEEDFIMRVLEFSAIGTFADKFYQSDDAAQLLIDCVNWGSIKLPSLLASKVPLLVPVARLNGETLLSYFLANELKHTKHLLDNLKPADLQPYKQRAIKALNKPGISPHLRATMLRIFRTRGLKIRDDELKDISGANPSGAISVYSGSSPELV